MAEVTTYTCDGTVGDACETCDEPATVTVSIGFPGRGAPHHEKAVELELDLCDEHVTVWREAYRPFVAEPEPEENGSGRTARDRTCKACGMGPTTAAGLAAHQRATGHKGSAEA